MKIKPINVIKKIHSTEKFLKEYSNNESVILNIGSSSVRFGNNCINTDIQCKPNVDILADAHNLPFVDSNFNIAIITAVLQLCRNPYKVSSEMHRILKSNGYIYVDAPFVQPYCRDMPDLFRFTKDGLIIIFEEHFSIVECGVSIPGGSSLAFYCQNLAELSTNRYLNFAWNTFISLLVLPFSWINFNKRSEVAGGFYLIGKKID